MPYSKTFHRKRNHKYNVYKKKKNTALNSTPLQHVHTLKLRQTILLFHIHSILPFHTPKSDVCKKASSQSNSKSRRSVEFPRGERRHTSVSAPRGIFLPVWWHSHGSVTAIKVPRVNEIALSLYPPGRACLSGVTVFRSCEKLTGTQAARSAISPRRRADTRC